MHNLVKVLDHENLRRDPDTGAVIDVDQDAYTSYLQAKQSRRQQQDRIHQLETRINSFESNLQDIKHLLHKLLENQHGHNN
jgi:hypothetical protein